MYRMKFLNDCIFFRNLRMKIILFDIIDNDKIYSNPTLS